MLADKSKGLFWEWSMAVQSNHLVISDVSLDYASSQLTQSALQYLAVEQNCRQIQTMTIGSKYTFDTFSKAPFISLSTKTWDSLKSITIFSSPNNFGDAGCALLKNLSSKNLKKLNLPQNKLTVKGLKQLLLCLWNLEYFQLDANQLDDEGCSLLSTSQWNLNLLSLNFNSIGPQGIRCLADSNWINLKFVHLRSNRIGDAGCKYLVRCRWPILQELSLNRNQLTDIATIWLSKSDWKHLTFLDLSSNPIKGGDKFRYFAGNNWVNLQQLYFKYEKMEKEVFVVLMKANWKQMRIISICTKLITRFSQQDNHL